MYSRYYIAGFLALGALLAAGCGGTPQMGGDEECMTVADALWTAVNLKQTEFLDRSEAEIDRLHTTGKMPEDAFQSLTATIAVARAGQWAEARKSLKTFIRGQRPASRAT